MEKKITLEEIKQLLPHTCGCGVKIPKMALVCTDCAIKVRDKMRKEAEYR